MDCLIESVCMKNGFTLIELLVVISIIGALSVASVAVYSSSQKRGRDARRREDLKSVQNAWEQYYGDNSTSYPSSCTFSVTPTPGVMSGSYLSNGLPADPKSGPTPTPYSQSCSTSAYCFCANLESETNSTKDCASGSPPSGYTGEYCVKNLQ